MPNQSFKRGILEQCVPSREEGQEKPSCNQLQAPESIHTILALQNGRLALSERNVAKGRFHMQTGHKGCIFFSTTLSILNKICQIFMAREPLLVPLPMFWLRPSTSNIYKTFKSLYIITEANEYSSDKIPRRYAFDGTNNGGNYNIQRYNHLASATSGFHFEHGGIDFESSPRDRNSWSDSKLCENDTFSARIKSKTDSDQWQDLYMKGFVTVLKLTKLIGLLASTIQAVLPA